jgi:hypothetical protein
MRLPMQWIDRYTLWHLVIVLGELVLLLIPWPRRAGKTLPQEACPQCPEVLSPAASQHSKFGESASITL